MYLNSKKITANKNIKIEILLIPCITFKLKFEVFDVLSFFQKRT